MAEHDKILLREVYKEFGSTKVLQGLNLAIRAGETLVVMGRSGCGKSVMLKILLGLILPDSGEIVIDDQEITQLSEKDLVPIRQKIGMLFQGSALFDSLTVGENVGYALKEHFKMPTEEIQQVVKKNLSFVDLAGAEDLMPAALSGGMKKRVALARAMAYQPEILLYDEPTTGLDPITATTINALIRKTQQELGVTSIVVTHELDSGFSVADRIAVINDGVIIEIGSLHEVQKSKNNFVKLFLAGPK
ncbi:MAG TPA: ABC transporter ATP-binding protein [bacterium]|nr:ABC transporter ATP-binding protein [bacterium]HOX85517.1 ABC transporter ATP-binding protein [bacterium]HPG44676.1 ABC transporter ATP-binding protein [bacterium]HPM99417.1 ABC transporter ATP-binding protein [bacterium]